LLIFDVLDKTKEESWKMPNLEVMIKKYRKKEAMMG
jgi:hypothetical protein